MEKWILAPEKKLPVSASCEVAVAGGGIAGIAAALAATRNGKKVILLEREYALGGMATLGLVTIYLPLCDGAGRQLVFGIGEELLRLSVKHGAEANYPEAWLNGGSLDERIRNRFVAQFNPCFFALEAEALLLSHGVTILYGTLACDVRKDGDRISHVIVENKSGRSAISVVSVIDCTGDADICNLAGAKTALHKSGNGLASWYYYHAGGKISLKMFGLADVAPNRRSSAIGPDDKNYDAAMVESLDPDFRFSGVDGEELSGAVIAGHAKMREDILKFREKDLSFVPVAISEIPLVRMSRRIAGAYTLDESADRIRMPDSIGTVGDWRTRGPAFEIPFGTLYGHDVRNLLVAGRDISVTDGMWDITRVIPACAVTGEAAGTAAALGDDFADIDIAHLQKRLLAQRVKLHID